MTGPIGGMYGYRRISRAPRHPASSRRRTGASVARTHRHPTSSGRRSGASAPAAAARIQARARVGGMDGRAVAAVGGAGGGVVGGGGGGGIVEGGGGGAGAGAAGGVVEVGEAGAAGAGEPFGRPPEAGVAVHPSLGGPGSGADHLCYLNRYVKS